MLLPLLFSLLLLVHSPFVPPPKPHSSKATYPTLQFGEGGKLALRGYGAIRSSTFEQTERSTGSKEIHSTFAMSRAKISLRYTLHKRLRARLDVELGTDTLEAQEASFQYALLPQLRLGGGRIRVPFGLAQTTGFLHQRLPTLPLITGNPKSFYDLGVIASFVAEWAQLDMALVTGSRDINPTSNDSPDAVGRVRLYPGRLLHIQGLRDLHLGGAVSYGRSPTRNAFRGRTPGGFTFVYPVKINGAHLRYGMELQWNTSRLSLRGEYQVDRMNREDIIEQGDDYAPYKVRGYYLEANLHLTGRQGSPLPTTGFELHGRFEQVEYSDGKEPNGPLQELDVTGLTLGLTYHHSAALKLSLLWQGLWFSDPRMAPNWRTPESWQQPDTPDGDWKPSTSPVNHHLYLQARFQF